MKWTVPCLTVRYCFLNSHPEQDETVHYALDDWNTSRVTEIHPSEKTYFLENRFLDIELPARSGKLVVLDPWARKEVRKRSAGILMPLSALPSSYGIGDIGGSASRFLEFLHDAGQSAWQILPYTQVDEFHSPYRSGSSFAGNLQLIDPDDLAERGFLDERVLELARKTVFDEKTVEYDKVWALKRELLHLAYKRYRENPDVFISEEEACRSFRDKERFWLEDHALFMALKHRHPGKTWNQWETGLARRDEVTLGYYRNQLKEQIEEEIFHQYLFFSQWDAMKRRSVERGIRIIGDLPLYVAYDSSDVWCHQELFKLNDDGGENLVAGVPPDYFSETGQRWGNPIYDWEEHERTGYSWWVRRVESLNRRVDTIRLDHFRGLADYYEILATEETATNGTWQTGPGIVFLRALQERIDGLDLVVENLGNLSYEANELKERSACPGMLVLQHLTGWYRESEPLPQLYQRREILYTGTHDDDTLKGFLKERAEVPAGMDLDGFALRTVRRLFMGGSDLVMVPLQDHLLLGSEARFNKPGVAEGNWVWRAAWEELDDRLSERLRNLVIESRRDMGDGKNVRHDLGT